MDVSREAPDVTTKPRCYDLTDIPAHVYVYVYVYVCVYIYIYIYI